MVTVAHMAPQEPDRFGVLFHEHGAALRRRLVKLLGNRQDAEDVYQDTYLKVQRLDPPQPRDPRGWLFTVGVRMAFSYLRRKRRAPTVPLSAEAEDVADERPLPEAYGLGHDAMRHLQKILQELPPQQRRVFYRYRILGESREDVAAQLNISLKTFETHYEKAAEHCRRRLAALGLGTQGGE